jgi:hypothetical protein
LKLLVHEVEAHEMRNAIQHPPVVYQDIPHSQFNLGHSIRHY